MKENITLILAALAVIVAIIAIPKLEQTWIYTTFSETETVSKKQLQSLSEHLTQLAQTDGANCSESLKLKVLEQCNSEGQVFNHIGGSNPIRLGTIEEYLETLCLSEQIEKVEIKATSNTDNTNKINRLDIVETRLVENNN